MLLSLAVLKCRNVNRRLSNNNRSCARGACAAGSGVVSVASLGQQLPPIIGDGKDRGVGACNKMYDVVGDQAIG
jgi:hypothetical protein